MKSGKAPSGDIDDDHFCKGLVQPDLRPLDADHIIIVELGKDLHAAARDKIERFQMVALFFFSKGF